MIPPRALLAPYELVRRAGREAEFEAADYDTRHAILQELRPLDDNETGHDTGAARYQHSWTSPESREEMARWQQIMQQQQGDPFVASQQIEMRVPPPRRCLDANTLDDIRQLAQRRGIDLQSDEALTIDADDAGEAMRFACLLSHERRCDLFRGQPADWNPVPSALRLEDSGGRWERFRAWAEREPALSAIAADQKKLGAIAQHYGIPTLLLDFSRNPRIAVFFATHTDKPVPDRPAGIYCLTSSALESGRHHAPAFMRFYEIYPQVERVEVEGLFRMQAQEGSFVYANQAWWTSMFLPDVIRFPRGQPVDSPTRDDIYPKVQSEIERLVSAFFASDA